MKKRNEEFLENVLFLLRVSILVYVVFCVIMWAYYMVTLHQIPNDCSVLSFSAHIGFIVLLLILMLLVVCT